MLAYGGNGPVFAAVQAEDLGITRVLIPRASPTFSALGTLVANPRIDEERSCIAPANRLDADKLKSLWRELADRAKKYFADAGFTPQQVRAEYQMNMRYPGQNFVLSLNVHVDQGLDDLSFVDESIGQRAIQTFNQCHMEEYGHIRSHEIPEVAGVRLATTVETTSPLVSCGFESPTVPAKADWTRRANLGQGFCQTDIFSGVDLRPGSEVKGPAIIEETFTTIAVYPGWQARVDDAGDYELTRV